ncbi:hypothetical protein [Acetobacterium bakii]|uniref:Lipoprotein n=1 Tax=Acetobacterium bakii TaxID=52689 RepID=A0A0L6TZ47_9FIRM|nr:hypothetical protein [Acetobacterium bakii]KNZ41551.1 hypothetical protein AKG39_11205 [Acetobacterium bakii]
MMVKARLRPIAVCISVLVGMLGFFSGCTNDDNANANVSSSDNANAKTDIIANADGSSNENTNVKTDVIAKADTIPENVIKNDPYGFYNKVQLNQTKDEVDSTLDLNTKVDISENAYVYTDEITGYGVSVSYNSANQVISKTIAYPKNADIASLSNAKVTEDQVAVIAEGMTYNDVKNLLGSDGVEVSRMQNTELNNEPTYIRMWINEDETAIMVAFVGNDEIVYKAKFLTK